MIETDDIWRRDTASQCHGMRSCCFDMELVILLLVCALCGPCASQNVDVQEAMRRLRSDVQLAIVTLGEKIISMEQQMNQMSSRVEALEKVVRDSGDKVAAQEVDTQFSDALSQANDQMQVLERKIQKLEALEEYRESGKTILRSCEEIRLFHPTLLDGYYQIDPDGASVGDEPITVYCELTTGTSFIGHNTLGSVAVAACEGIGCYQVPITYQASMRQIIALIRQSLQCRQVFEWQFDCNSDPLDLVESSDWLDRLNISHSMASCTKHQDFSGSICSISSCPGHDDSDWLPVTRLNFGRSFFNSVEVSDTPVKSKFSLGKLQCSGWVQGAKGQSGLKGEPGQPGPKGPAGLPGPRGEDGKDYCPSTETNNFVCPDDLGPSTSCHQAPFPFGCYCLVQIRQNWTQASDFCQSHAMELVSIETREENKMLRRLLVPFRYDMWWTSGSDESYESRWMWTATNRPIVFANWDEGRPNGGTSKNFLFCSEQGRHLLWYDHKVSEEIYSICEH